MGKIDELGVKPLRSLEGMDAVVVIINHAIFKNQNWMAEAVKIRHQVTVDGRFIVPLLIRKQGIVLIRLDGC